MLAFVFNSPQELLYSARIGNQVYREVARKYEPASEIPGGTVEPCH